MDYNEMTKDELYDEIKERDISGCSQDNKDELIRKLKVEDGMAVNITRPAVAEPKDNQEPVVPLTPMGDEYPEECNSDCPRYNRPDKECEACWTARHIE